MMKNYFQINKLLKTFRLVLASGSPRRVKLLSDNGIAFRQLIPNIDESNSFNLGAYELATHLAEQKAKAALEIIEDNELILGSDTIVVLNDEILGKPRSFDDAVSMLTRLSGQKHIVCSAIALLDKFGHVASGYELTDVYFKPVSIDQIEAYVKSGEPMDKAGSYGIQEIGKFLVDRINGNIDNVIGLPMTLLEKLSGKLSDLKDL